MGEFLNLKRINVVIRVGQVWVQEIYPQYYKEIGEYGPSQIILKVLNRVYGGNLSIPYNLPYQSYEVLDVYANERRVLADGYIKQNFKLDVKETFKNLKVLNGI